MVDENNYFEKVSEFVRTHAIKNDILTYHYIAQAQLIFENINTGHWTFGKEIDIQGAAEAISLSTEIKINKIVVVSISLLPHLPRHITYKLHNDFIAQNKNFGITLHNRFNHDFHTKLDHNTRLNFMILMDLFHGGNIHKSVKNSLNIGFMDKLQDSYAHNVWQFNDYWGRYTGIVWPGNPRGSIKTSLSNIIVSNIHVTLSRFLGLVIIGDEEKIKSLTPAIWLLTKGIVPLCENTDEPGSYLVATA